MPDSVLSTGDSKRDSIVCLPVTCGALTIADCKINLVFQDKWFALCQCKATIKGS